VPPDPTKDEVIEARDTLLDVVSDFPFLSDVYKATFLAALLTPLARYAFSGPAPLFLIDSNIRGSGKGLSLDVIALVTTGRAMPVMANPETDEEARKRITALAVGGDPLILIDNIAGSLGSPALDAALTSTVWQDRILGRTEIVKMPLLATWYATGNNVVLLADTSRRVAHIRLESKLENPEERDGFKYPNLREHIRQNRGRLLACALTILHAYSAAGWPDMKLKPWGSFEGWSDLVRSAVVWADMDDPGDTRKELRSRSDQEAGALLAILDGIEYLDKLGGGLTVSQIISLATSADHWEQKPVVALREAIIQLCPTRGKDFPSHCSIGKKFQHLEGRVAGGKYLHRETVDHTGVWSVCTV
jgi:hypothetical protein